MGLRATWGPEEHDGVPVLFLRDPQSLAVVSYVRPSLMAVLAGKLYFKVPQLVALPCRTYAKPPAWLLAGWGNIPLNVAVEALTELPDCPEWWSELAGQITGWGDSL